jgi:hypothetical protein
MYNHPTYTVVNQAAKHWFIILSQIEEAKAQALREVLEGYSMIGALVGHEEDIILYQIPDLVFFSFVANNSDCPSVSPQEASNYFRHYDLPSVKFHHSQPIRNLKDFKLELDSMHNEVYKGTLKNGDEGAYMFIMRPMEEQSVISITVVKNLEF